MNNYFIYDHVYKMTKVVSGIRKNRYSMMRKSEFDMADLELLDFMLDIITECQAFIHRLPANVEAGLKSSHPNWIWLKKHLENQLKSTVTAIKLDKKIIEHRINKDKNHLAHEDQVKKLEQINLMRIEAEVKKAYKEGSN